MAPSLLTDHFFFGFFQAGEEKTRLNDNVIHQSKAAGAGGRRLPGDAEVTADDADGPEH
jgi:hypothetical protein